MAVLAVVVTYNRCKLLRRCLSSLEAQTAPCDILVVDNASTDETGYWQGGFGYDPLFLCETGETFAEISRECKNAISHRKRGIEAVLRALEEQQ